MEHMEYNNDLHNDVKVEKKDTAVKMYLPYLHDLVCLIAGVILVFSLLFRIVVVSGPSMNNTLIDGDMLLLLSDVVYGTPQKGDIIVASKDSFDNGSPIIKRVIATQGQTVDIDFDQGIVYVDGVALDEPYTNTPTNQQEGIVFPLTVDDGCIFVMGDNRNISKDSRSTEIGLIDCREVLGKAIILFFPGDPDGVNGPDKRQLNRIGAVS